MSCKNLLKTTLNNSSVFFFLSLSDLIDHIFVRSYIDLILIYVVIDHSPSHFDRLCLLT